GAGGKRGGRNRRAADPTRRLRRLGGGGPGHAAAGAEPLVRRGGRHEGHLGASDDRPTTTREGAVLTSKVMAIGATKGSGKVQQCDVLILGSGLAGSVSAAILARQGANVVLVDAASHPRFAVGESMTPQLIEWLHILADRFDVPEIRHLLDVKAVTRHIGPFHGKKQSFGFIKHNPG